ncbi:hypothetical protein OBBRIDRAFT_888758 [Obba rivulosa]|uniref:Uncharacterized protein n=1 Tax=Obba rivulosa TaxID=1052685 RepID=A0A8E2AVK2_9APHY|nr:hypothetical protein OBBRIDRAFT_888758 [Obba rivulosa]
MGDPDEIIVSEHDVYADAENSSDEDLDNNELPPAVINIVLPVLEAADQLTSEDPSYTTSAEHDSEAGRKNEVREESANEPRKHVVLRADDEMPQAVLDIVMPVLEAAEQLVSAEPLDTASAEGKLERRRIERKKLLRVAGRVFGRLGVGTMWVTRR